MGGVASRASERQSERRAGEKNTSHMGIRRQPLSPVAQAQDEEHRKCPHSVRVITVREYWRNWAPAIVRRTRTSRAPTQKTPFTDARSLLCRRWNTWRHAHAHAHTPPAQVHRHTHSQNTSVPTLPSPGKPGKLAPHWPEWHKRGLFFLPLSHSLSDIITAQAKGKEEVDEEEKVGASPPRLSGAHQTDRTAHTVPWSPGEWSRGP